jgi:signal transduction histidine kinase
LWELVDAGIFLSSELQLDKVLDRIVETACKIVGCRYGAVGVVNAERTGLSNFVYRGISEAERELIGDLPLGHGLLGALIDDPRPIRLDDLGADPRSVGFPENHPPMKSFLGVPVAAKGNVFGNLYLTEKKGGGPFTEEDERLAIVLAAQAGVAVENARLYKQAKAVEEQATLRLREIEFVQEIGHALLAEFDPKRVLRMIVHHARGLVGGDTAAIALLDDDGVFRLRVAAGKNAGAMEGLEIPFEGSYSQLAMTTLESVMVKDSLNDSRVDPTIARTVGGRSSIIAPLTDQKGAVGVLGVVRPDPNAFDKEDLFMAKRFADLASLALRNARLIAAERERVHIEAELTAARLREDLRAQALRDIVRGQEEERRRIARELHDSFGQSLASILLGLKVVEQERTLPEARARLADLREVTAEAASEVRRIALELRPSALDDLGLTPVVERLAADVGERTGVRVSTSIALGGRLHEDVETVVYRIAQEAVTNAVKYALARKISLALSDTDGTVTLVVSDDGRGFDVGSVKREGLGLVGMEERAALVGGKVIVDSNPGTGTTVTLEVPIEAGAQ